MARKILMNFLGFSVPVILGALFFTTAVRADYEFDVFAGTGWSWSTWDNYDPIRFPRRESELEGFVSMRESFLTGLRLINVGSGNWMTVYGLEVNYFYSAPKVNGTWKYVQRDANENINLEVKQPNSSDTVPLVNSAQVAGILGLRHQIVPNVAVEGSLHLGLGAGTAKYRISYPDGSGGIAGITGPAVQFTARLAMKFFVSSSLAIGLEGRSIFESVSDNLYLIRSKSDNQRLVNTLGHLLLASITYRLH